MRFSSVLLVVALFSSSTGARSEAQEPRAMPNQKAHTFETQITKTVRLNYLLFLPSAYDASGGAKYPLILFLHGAGERGSDVEKIKVHGIPKVAVLQPDFPFIAVSPQCPQNSWWTAEVDALTALLDDVVARYRVDTNRVYLTGLSMGGFGTWALATEHPERFAAIAPICGGGDPSKVDRIKDIPAWVFHGAKDEVVKPEQSETMVKALQALGADVRYTVYAEAGHDSWTEAYDNPELYTWFLSHSLSDR